MQSQIAFIFIVTGVVIGAIGYVWLLGAAFMEHFLWGTACLLFPVAAIVFIAANWDVSHKPFTVAMTGYFIALAGTTFIVH